MPTYRVRPDAFDGHYFQFTFAEADTPEAALMSFFDDPINRSGNNDLENYEVISAKDEVFNYLVSWAPRIVSVTPGRLEVFHCIACKGLSLSGSLREFDGIFTCSVCENLDEDEA